MEDSAIVRLFFDRSEQVIAETDKKYGGYCYSPEMVKKAE